MIASLTTEQEAAQVVELLASKIVTTRVAVLLVLLGRDTRSYRSTALAQVLHMKPAAITMLGDAMVSDGLLQRTFPFRDRRTIALCLTPQGEALAVEMLAKLRQFGSH